MELIQQILTLLEQNGGLMLLSALSLAANVWLWKALQNSQQSKEEMMAAAHKQQMADLHTYNTKYLEVLSRMEKALDILYKLTRKQ